MLHGSHGDSRRSAAHPYGSYVKPGSSQSAPYAPMRNTNSIPSFSSVSNGFQFTGVGNSGINQFWTPALPNSALNSHDALSHPRIVPNSPHSNINYTSPLVPLSSSTYDMGGIMTSPPLGSAPISTSQRATETDPYHVPPLGSSGFPHSSTTSPPTASDSSAARRGSGPTPTSPKKRKSGEGKLPTFLVKLYELLKEPKYPDLLSWDETGQFIVAHTSNPRLLEVLRSEYNQNRVASFTRQLNIYGWMRDNITRNTESTEPTLWRHEVLNRNSDLNDLLTTGRRVAPRTSQAEKRRKQEEEDQFNSSHHNMPLPPTWPYSNPSAGSFTLGTSAPVDTSFRHRRERSRRHSFHQGAGFGDYDDFGTPTSTRDALPLHLPPTQVVGSTNGGMMSMSAPSSAATDQFFPIPHTSRMGTGSGTGVISEVPESSYDCGILSNSAIRYLHQQGAFNRSTNTPLQFDPADASSWSRHGLSTLGKGLKPFQPAPLRLKDERPASPIQAISNGIDTLRMPQTPQVGTTLPAPSAPPIQSPPPAQDSPEEPTIVTPPPLPPPPLPQTTTVVPGSYMSPGACRSNTALISHPWRPRSSRQQPPNGGSLTRSEVLAPRSSSVLQRVMHGQSGLPFVAEDEGDGPLPSARLPQPRLFDDFEEPAVAGEARSA